MYYFIECKNPYCERKWNDSGKPDECPWCGSFLIIIEELPEPIQACKSSKRKKKKLK